MNERVEAEGEVDRVTLDHRQRSAVIDVELDWNGQVFALIAVKP